MGSKKSKNRFISIVLKSYLVFLFLVIGLLVFGPTDEIEGHASVNSTNDESSVLDLGEYDFGDFFEINFKPFASYVLPGDKDVKISEISILAKKNPIRICSLKFKIFGLSEDGVSNAFLVDENGKKFIGTLEDGYISFPGIFKKSYPETDASYSLFVNFPRDLEVGERVTFGFEKPEDLNITVSGEQVFQKLQYPLYGPYFSTVNHFTSVLN